MGQITPGRQLMGQITHGRRLMGRPTFIKKKKKCSPPMAARGTPPCKRNLREVGFEQGTLGIKSTSLHHYATSWIVILL
jgi:hypothetical protein